MTGFVIRPLQQTDYQTSYLAMQALTTQRIQHDQAAVSHTGELSQDEFWWTMHPPVYTQGVAGKAEHILSAVKIPVISTNRGGQITYHGPGQLVLYTMVNLNRLELGTRQFVNLLEQVVIDFLNSQALVGHRRHQAPGVYINEAKIASIGLRVSKGYSYHGLSLNVAMDLTPFESINPCGYAGLRVTDLQSLGGTSDLPFIMQTINTLLIKSLYR